jgi:hypothetical protein
MARKEYVKATANNKNKISIVIHNGEKKKKRKRRATNKRGSTKGVSTTNQQHHAPSVIISNNTSNPYPSFPQSYPISIPNYLRPPEEPPREMARMEEPLDEVPPPPVLRRQPSYLTSPKPSYLKELKQRLKSVHRKTITPNFEHEEHGHGSLVHEAFSPVGDSHDALLGFALPHSPIEAKGVLNEVEAEPFNVRGKRYIENYLELEERNGNLYFPTVLKMDDIHRFARQAGIETESKTGKKKTITQLKNEINEAYKSGEKIAKMPA